MKAHKIESFIHLIVKDLDVEDEKEIVVERSANNTPLRWMDYTACFKEDIGENDGQIPTGWGATQQEAIDDLLQHA